MYVKTGYPAFPIFSQETHF